MKKILKPIIFNIKFYWYILKTLFSLWKATRNPSNLKKVREIAESLEKMLESIKKKGKQRRF